MKPDKTIEHEGVIHEITPHTTQISVLQQSACASCHANGACSTADTDTKYITVPTDDNYKVGQHVYVRMQAYMGTTALLLGYIAPFLVLMVALITTYYFTANDLYSGLAAIGILLPYYFILYLLRNRIGKAFVFTVREAEN